MEQITIIGTLGADAEVKDLTSNQVIEFSVAVSENWTDKQGQKQSKTTWFSCAKWGNNTSVAQYIKKGDKIFVQGKTANRAYLKADGTAQVVNGITVDRIMLLGSKNENATATDPKPQPSNSFADEPFKGKKEFTEPLAQETEPDDLPF